MCVKGICRSMAFPIIAAGERLTVVTSGQCGYHNGAEKMASRDRGSLYHGPSTGDDSAQNLQDHYFT